MILNRIKTGMMLFLASQAVMLTSCANAGTPQTVAVPESVAEASAEDLETEPDTAVADDNVETPNPLKEGENLISSGTFDAESSLWGMYTESQGVGSYSISGGKLSIHVSDPGRVEHAVQMYCDGIELLEGAKYLFSCDISSTVPRNIEWRIQVNGGDYHPYVDMTDVSIGPDVTTITSDFTMIEASDPAARMCFNLGDKDREQNLESHDIMIDNVSLMMTDGTNAKKVENMAELSGININQIGYRPGDEKRALLRSRVDTFFEVVDTSTGEVVFTGDVTEGISKGSSGDEVGYGDFSQLSKPGTYRIRTQNSGESYDFTIGDGVYDDALRDTLRMFYLQRCGTELPKELAGDFAHPACHTEEARIYGGKGYKEVSGGWHDAGDYGRYTVPAAKAVADLLLSYECFPDAFDDDNNIPESGNGIPDVLDEARYELDWLLKMQADDGGVYHKVTGLNFDEFILPEDCTEELYLLPESKTATADFAGVMFMASRVYEDIDGDFSSRCKAAAERALNAYIAHKDDRNFVNPPDCKTGEYVDTCSVDEYLWAICEAIKTTQDPKYEKMLASVDMDKLRTDDFGWEDMSGYAYYAFLTSKNSPRDVLGIRNRFMKMCDDLKDTALSGEAYGVTMTDDYPWGSNMYIANNGMALLMAGKITGNNDYIRAAKRQLDYLLGVNTNSYCFLTGYGTQSPVDPHHRPSVALGKPMKGMLVGGPDSRLEDPFAKAVLSGLPKARCYTDNSQSYSCNEITIYWNSPLCFLLAGLK